MLLLSGKTSHALSGWRVATWLAVAGIPSALYCVQNLSALLAYQNLDPLTFNVLNQTKTLSAALCCYIVMGRKQSQTQIFSLLLLLIAALIMEGAVPSSVPSLVDMLRTLGHTATHLGSTFTNESIASTRHFTHGVAPVLLASFLSGLAGALSQKNLQCNDRNSYLFSMELCAASSIILIASLFFSGDWKILYEKGLFENWTRNTIIPIFTNSLGGIIVGLVTKHAGSVQKGFALVFGIFLSGLLQAVISTENGTSISGGRVTQEQVVGGTLAAMSLLMHCMNPYVPPPREGKNGTSSSKMEHRKTAVPLTAKTVRKSRKED